MKQSCCVDRKGMLLAGALDKTFAFLEEQIAWLSALWTRCKAMVEGVGLRQFVGSEIRRTTQASFVMVGEAPQICSFMQGISPVANSILKSSCDSSYWHVVGN